MSILSKKLFTWREPRPFLTVLDGQERIARRWWHRPAIVAVICLFPLFNWYLGHFDPSMPPPSFPVALLLSIGLGVFLAYFIPWITNKLPSQIKVLDRCITRTRGGYYHQVLFLPNSHHSHGVLGLSFSHLFSPTVAGERFSSVFRATSQSTRSLLFRPNAFQPMSRTHPSRSQNPMKTNLKDGLASSRFGGRC